MKTTGNKARLPCRSIAATLLILACITARSAAQRNPTIAIDAPSWHLESSTDSIEIFSSSVRGTGVVPLKATMVIPGTIEEISLTIEDIPRRREWVRNLDRSVLIERPNDYEQTEYMRVNVPWPASDRSAIVRALITVDDDFDKVTIAGQSVDVRGPDSLPRLVRATVYESTFQMTQLGDRVEVVMLVFIDPCGIIPKWIVNYFTRGVARATLTGLHRQVSRRLYTPSQIGAMHERMRAFRAFREQQSIRR